MSTVDLSTEFGAHVAKRLETDTLIWLTTVGSTGTPYPTLVWFLWTNSEVLIFSQPDKPKLRHLARNQQVTLNFQSNSHGGDVVVMHGVARAPAELPTEEERKIYAQKYAEGIKSLGMTYEQLAAKYSVPIRIRLEKLRGWA